MAASALRQARVRDVLRLRKQGLSSSEIGKRLGLKPSTVRDYWNDPDRAKARIRQRKYGVVGIKTVTEMHPPWKRSRPADTASSRGRQMRALTGYYARRG